MLEALKVIILGIVEGITEWLPISSTGHLILVEEFVKLNFSQSYLDMFNVVIQLGAIMAVVVIYFHRLNPFSPKKTEKQKKMTLQLWVKVVIASIPAGVVGCVVSFVVSILAIKFLLKYIQNHDFKAFGYYRIVLGIIVFLYFGIHALLA